MSLMRRNTYDPFYDMDRAMDRMWNRMRPMFELTANPLTGEALDLQDANMLAVDVTSDDKNVIVRTALPGFKEEDVNVDVKGNLLTITAESTSEREDKAENWHVREMRYGKFARSVMLPEEVHIEKSEATLENGILTIKLPKQKENPIKKIAVKARGLLKSGNSKDS